MEDREGMVDNPSTVSNTEDEIVIEKCSYRLSDRVITVSDTEDDVTIESYTYRIRSSQKEEMKSCIFCGKVFRLQHSLEIHLERFCKNLPRLVPMRVEKVVGDPNYTGNVNRKKLFTCRYCGYTYTKACHRASHIKKVHHKSSKY